MRIGMIGLGRMGANMTQRLLRGGHEVVAFDLSETNRKEAAGYGAVPAATLLALASANRRAWSAATSPGRNSSGRRLGTASTSMPAEPRSSTRRGEAEARLILSPEERQRGARLTRRAPTRGAGSSRAARCGPAPPATWSSGSPRLRPASGRPTRHSDLRDPASAGCSGRGARSATGPPWSAAPRP